MYCLKVIKNKLLMKTI